jgi:L-rhamnose isomerase
VQAADREVGDRGLDDLLAALVGAHAGADVGFGHHAPKLVITHYFVKQSVFVR